MKNLNFVIDSWKLEVTEYTIKRKHLFQLIIVYLQSKYLQIALAPFKFLLSVSSFGFLFLKRETNKYKQNGPVKGNLTAEKRISKA